MGIEDERIGARLRALRGEMSQAALAEAMVKSGFEKWSQATVWSIEQGKRPLRFSEAEAIAQILDKTVGAFSGLDPIDAALGKVSQQLFDAAKTTYAALLQFMRSRRNLLYLLENSGRTVDELASNVEVVHPDSADSLRRYLGRSVPDYLDALREVLEKRIDEEWARDAWLLSQDGDGDDGGEVDQTNLRWGKGTDDGVDPEA